MLGQAWLIASMALTGTAAILLATRIIPSQASILRSLRAAPATAADATDRVLRLLGMQAGLFAALWAVVVVLMITRPGSSTGV